MVFIKIFWCYSLVYVKAELQVLLEVHFWGGKNPWPHNYTDFKFSVPQLLGKFNDFQFMLLPANGMYMV